MIYSAASRHAPSSTALDIRSRYKFGSLVQSYVGLVESVRFLPIEIGDPEIEVASTVLGNDFTPLPDCWAAERIGGAGSDIDVEGAWVRAVAEAAERYATTVYSERDFVVATGKELGSDALDLLDVPRCSETELRNPRCPLALPSKDAAIRWLRGYSLVHQKHLFVPAVMTHLYIHPWDSERFWHQISTGVAAHTSLHSALVAAICESIERDAIALMWLGKLPLPPIARDSTTSAALATVLDRYDRAGVLHYEYDATTDLGVPTVFSVQTSAGHPYCALSVSCATEFDPEKAQTKALREACSARVIMNKAYEIPRTIEDFYGLTHGAHYYGLGGHEADFNFLLSGARKPTTFSTIDNMTLSLRDNRDEDRLAFLITRLRNLGLDAIAVDLSTDEVRDAGLWVVRVVIPNLMPISFVYRARYLGTPRLYEYVRHFVNSEFNERDVNAAPLPFA